MDETSIERLATEELLSEAKRGAARASSDGPTGWQKCPLPRTNKRFLCNTLLHSLQWNRVLERPDSAHRKGSTDSRRPRTQRRKPETSTCVQHETIDVESEWQRSKFDPNNVSSSSNKKSKVIKHGRPKSSSKCVEYETIDVESEWKRKKSDKKIQNDLSTSSKKKSKVIKHGMPKSSSKCVEYEMIDVESEWKKNKSDKKIQNNVGRPTSRKKKAKVVIKHSSSKRDDSSD